MHSSLNQQTNNLVQAKHKQSHVLKAESENLKIVIHLDNNLISDMTFSGLLSTDPILQIYKKHCIGYSLRECAEHSAIFAVSEVTKASSASPQNGIIGLHQVSPTLKAAQDILRQINRSVQSSEDGWNFNDRGLSQAWTAQSKERQRSQIERIQNDLLEKLGFGLTALKLEIIDQYGRLFYQFSEQIEAMTKASLLMKLEHELQDKLGERIEVFLTEMKDQNKIRRL